MKQMGKHILHVEDDPIQQMIVTSLLKGIADITQAETLEKATALINDSTYELILLDLTLPDGSGLDLLNTLSDNANKPPVIIFSAHEVTDSLHNAAAVLVKGHYKEQDFVNFVRTLLTEA
jgi:DNA-binding response OmpR family regulator